LAGEYEALFPVGKFLSRAGRDAWSCSKPSWRIKECQRALEEETGGPFGLCGFEQASSRTCPPLHAHMRCGLANPIGHTGAVMQLQRIERPIRVGNHSDAAFVRDQNGQVGGDVAGLHSAFRGFHQLHRVVYKSTHNLLIVKAAKSLNLIWARPGLFPYAIPKAVY